MTTTRYSATCTDELCSMYTFPLTLTLTLTLDTHVVWGGITTV